MARVPVHILIVLCLAGCTTANDADPSAPSASSAEDVERLSFEMTFPPAATAAGFTSTRYCNTLWESYPDTFDWIDTFVKPLSPEIPANAARVLLANGTILNETSERQEDGRFFVGLTSDVYTSRQLWLCYYPNEGTTPQATVDVRVEVEVLIHRNTSASSSTAT